MVAVASPHRFTADQYRQMTALDIPPRTHRAELRDGIVYALSPDTGEMPRPYRFTADEYERMAEAGILAFARVELIHGEILQMSAMGDRHMRCVDLLTRLLVRSIPDELLVHVQSTVYLDSGNAPEPDLAVIVDRGPGAAATRAADALLVIEVSDSTLAYDRGGKRTLYAAAGIPEYWIVDLAGATVTRYTAPHDAVYAQEVTARAGETLASTPVPLLRIPVATVLS